MSTGGRWLLLLLCILATLPVLGQNTLRIGSNIPAFPNSEVLVPVYCTNDAPIHSLSISLQHDAVMEIGMGNTVPTIDFTGSIIDTVLSGGTPALLDIEYDAATNEMTTTSQS